MGALPWADQPEGEKGRTERKEGPFFTRSRCWEGGRKLPRREKKSDYWEKEIWGATMRKRKEGKVLI